MAKTKKAKAKKAKAQGPPSAPESPGPPGPPEPKTEDLAGISKSRVVMTGFKGKKPPEVAAEKERHAGLAKKRTANRITKAKVKAKQKPVDARRELLTARLKKCQGKKQQHNYTTEQVEGWIRELEFIHKNPKAWKKGIGAAKKISLDDKLDAVLATAPENAD